MDEPIILKTNEPLDFPWMQSLERIANALEASVEQQKIANKISQGILYHSKELEEKLDEQERQNRNDG